jgi:hypothetical protein
MVAGKEAAMKTRRSKSVMLVVTSLAAAAVKPAVASPATTLEAQPLAKDAADRFVGNYHFAGGDRERAARDAAIDDVVEDMNFLVRGIARKRLKESNRIPERVSISRKDSKLTIRLDDRTYTAPINGGAVDVVGITGAEMKLRHRVISGRIEQIFEGKDGGRMNQLELDGEGRLTIHVRVFSDRLPKDLRYKLTYGR